MENETKKINCGICGYPNDVNSKFCSNCGGKVDDGVFEQPENIENQVPENIQGDASENIQSDVPVNSNENAFTGDTGMVYQQPSAPVIYSEPVSQDSQMPPPYISAPTVTVTNGKKINPLILLIPIVLLIAIAVIASIILMKKSPVEKILSAAEKTYGIDKCNFRVTYSGDWDDLTFKGAINVNREKNDIYLLGKGNNDEVYAIYKDTAISGEDKDYYIDEEDILDNIDLSKKGIDGFKDYYEEEIEDFTDMDFDEFKEANKDLIKELTADKEDNDIISDFETARVKGGEEYTFKVDVLELMDKMSDIYDDKDLFDMDYYDKSTANCDITVVGGYITRLNIKISYTDEDDYSETAKIRLQINDINSKKADVDKDELKDIYDDADDYSSDRDDEDYYNNDDDYFDGNDDYGDGEDADYYDENDDYGYGDDEDYYDENDDYGYGDDEDYYDENDDYGYGDNQDYGYDDGGDYFGPDAGNA